MRISKIEFKYSAVPNTYTKTYKPDDTNRSYTGITAHYPYFIAHSPNTSDIDFEKDKKEVSEICRKLEEEEGWELNKLLDEDILTKTNIKLAKKLLKNENFPIYEIYPIIAKTANCTTSQEEELKVNFAEELCRDENFPTYHIPNILKYTTNKNLTAAKKLCNADGFPKRIIPETLNNIQEISQEETDGLEYFIKIYKRCKNKPELYVNTNNNSSVNPGNAVDLFFKEQSRALIKLTSLQDNALNDILLRKRFAGMKEYLKIINNFNREQMQLLSFAIKCNNTDGTNLTAPEKVELIDIINTNALDNNSLTDLKAMINTGEVNIQSIKEKLIEHVMAHCYSCDVDIPKDKLKLWDINYCYLIIEELQKHESEKLTDLIKLANLNEEFKDIIQDPDNEYGQINNDTRLEFQKYNLNYDRWISPSKNNEVKIISYDENRNKLQQLEEEFCKNVNKLINSPANTFIKKKYGKYIDKNMFELPAEISTNATRLKEFMVNFLSELTPVWKRAEKSFAEGKKTQAGNTLTIKEHIQTYINEVENTKHSPDTKNINLTIKIWDRIPQHDLFQGNYSTCCIGMGNINSAAMYDYLTQTAFNMIEVVDNDTNNTVGNALCYYIYTENHKPALIIDNIEINNSYKPSQDICKKIREGIKEYAQNLNQEVGNGQEIPVYLGKNYNDVPDNDLKSTTIIAGLIYSPDNEFDDFYLDAFGGWNNEYRNLNFQKLTRVYEL